MVDDWPSYNESLVIHGEILLDPGLLQSWGEELEKLNGCREGGRYLYPDSLIRLQVSLRTCFRLPYRQLEGFTRAISRWEPRLDPDEWVTLAVDASGIKVADRGEWMRTKWRRRRGFLKIHIAVDVKTKQIVALEVTDERTGDSGMLESLVEQAEGYCRIVRVLLDGAYDSRRNFSYLAGKGIDPVIRVRRNSSRRARGCPARKRVVLEYLRDPEEWKRRVGYGRRWMAEMAFSTFKRMFGEHVTARKFPNMVREMVLKARLYNLFTSLNSAPCAVHA